MRTAFYASIVGLAILLAASGLRAQSTAYLNVQLTGLNDDIVVSHGRLQTATIAVEVESRHVSIDALTDGLVSDAASIRPEALREVQTDLRIASEAASGYRPH